MTRILIGSAVLFALLSALPANAGEMMMTTPPPPQDVSKYQQLPTSSTAPKPPADFKCDAPKVPGQVKNRMSNYVWRCVDPPPQSDAPPTPATPPAPQ